MNRKQLAQRVMEALGYTFPYSAVQQIQGKTFEEIENALIEGQSVSVYGFGMFLNTGEFVPSDGLQQKLKNNKPD